MHLYFLTLNIILSIVLQFSSGHVNNSNSCQQSSTPVGGRSRRCIGFDRFPQLRVEQSPDFQPKYITAKPYNRAQDRLASLQGYLAAGSKGPDTPGRSHLSQGNRLGINPSSNYRALRPISGHRREEYLHSNYRPIGPVLGRRSKENHPRIHPSSNYRPIEDNGNIREGPVIWSYQKTPREKKPTRFSKPISSPYKTKHPRKDHKPALNDFEQDISVRSYQDTTRDKKPTRFVKPGLSPYEIKPPRMEHNPVLNDFERDISVRSYKYSQNAPPAHADSRGKNPKVKRYQEIFPRKANSSPCSKATNSLINVKNNRS